MRLTRAILASIIAIGLALPALAQPSYGLRTLLVDIPTTATYQDDTHQFCLSKLHGPYVCPICGYSSPTPGNCPNPLGLGNPPHPPAVPLVPARVVDRVLNVVKPDWSGAGDPSCDIQWRDTIPPVGPDTWDTPNQFRVVTGRPFHPTRTGAAAGSPAEGNQVHAEFWRDNPPANERAYFLTIPPGVKEPAAYIEFDETVDSRVHHDAANPITAAELDVALNPHRAVDDDTYYIRYWSFDGGGFMADAWRVQVFSRLYGCEFDSGGHWGDMLPMGAPYRIVTGSGSAIITLPDRQDPVPSGMFPPFTVGVWDVEFDIRSNCTPQPDPQLGPAPTGWPGAPGSDLFALFGDVITFTGGGVWFDFDASDTVRNTSQVQGIAAGTNGTPYDIQPGETGVGRVETHWRDSTWVLPWVYSFDTTAVMTTYFVNTGVECWYHDDDDDPATNNAPTNNDIAQTPPLAPFTEEYQPIESRFLCTPYQVAKCDHGTNDRHGLPVEPNPATPDAYARVLLGDEAGGVRDDTVRAGDPTNRRQFAINNLLTQQDVYHYCPACGTLEEASASNMTVGNACPYCGVGTVEEIEAGGGRLVDHIVHSMMVPEVGAGGLLWSNIFPTLRPHIPGSAVHMGPQGQYVPPGSSHATYGGATHWASVDVPTYQRASEPGDAPGNSANYEMNWGYRGMAVAHEPTGSVASVYDDNGKWDAYFVCPDCGMPYTGVVGAIVTGNCFQCQNPACPGHEYCPACGCIYPAGTTNCPFDGTALVVVDPTGGDDNFGFKHIGAEAFDPYDIQVAVLKNLALASGRQTTDMGRVGPGIDLAAPNAVVAGAGGTPALRRPDPANISHYGKLVLRNEGNTLPSVVGLNPNAVTLDAPLYRMFRPDADQDGRGYGWAGTRNPVAQWLMLDYYDEPTLTEMNPDSAGVPIPWQPVMQASGSAAGVAAPAATQIGLPAAMGGGNLDVVGTGQVLGRYSGSLAYYMDQDGDGLFDFLENGSVPTTSAVSTFDPVRDVGMEPYVFGSGQLRVSEASLPQNDPSAKDAAPIARIDYGGGGEPSRLQIMMMTDRTTVPGAGSGASVGLGAFPATDAPSNLVYVNATPVGADENRNYVWNNVQNVTVLTDNTGPLAQNGPVDVYPDDSGNLFAIWHATNRAAGGLKATIQIANDLGATGAWNHVGPLWVGQARAEGVRGFYDPDEVNGGADAAHWAFWHTGLRGHETLMYKVTRAADGVVLREGRLPFDSSTSPTNPDPTEATVHDVDGIGPEAAVPVTLQKFMHGPFKAVKDVSPMLYLPPLIYDTTGGASDTQPQVRVFFAGYAKHRHNFDIYETRFNRADFLAGANNLGKIEFPRVGTQHEDQSTTEGLPIIDPTNAVNGDFTSGPGEELESDVLRREFHSMHLDWSTSTNFLNGGGTGDATLILGIRLAGVTAPEYDVQYYDVRWGPANPARGERYDKKRGAYLLIPRFERYDVLFSDIPTPPAGPVAAPSTVGAFELIEPNTLPLPVGEQRPIKMEVDPTMGRVRFSAPLFNSLNPTDLSCVFQGDSLQSLGGGFAASQITDVFICGRYSPFANRLTTSPADDDCPSAIMESGPWEGNVEAPAAQARPWALNSHNNNLMLFWRRSFGSGQAPYHGRTCYMMKKWSWTIQVNHPPIQAPKNAAIVNLPGGQPDPQLRGPGMPTEITGPLPGPYNLPPGLDEYDVDLTNGLIAVWPGVYRWYDSPNGTQQARGPVRPGTNIQVQYTDLAGVVHTESHRLGGWSQEAVVPIDTVIAEGPLRVAEETYTVPWSPTAAPNDPRPVARRYWVTWTSPRPSYDLRLPGAGGSDVWQSSDVYYCTIAPHFPTLTRARRASSHARDVFRP